LNTERSCIDKNNSKTPNPFSNNFLSEKTADFKAKFDGYNNDDEEYCNKDNLKRETKHATKFNKKKKQNSISDSVEASKALNSSFFNSTNTKSNLFIKESEYAQKSA
jgi:hypothetical protein